MYYNTRDLDRALAFYTRCSGSMSASGRAGVNGGVDHFGFRLASEADVKSGRLHDGAVVVRHRVPGIGVPPGW
jgi:catechol 2,3-dioxygenase-like lactoylglutathione lyase family enzyme